MQLSGGATTELSVGPRLTRLVDQHEPASALAWLTEHSWIQKLTPAEAEITLRLATPSIPPARWRSDDEQEPMLGPGILALDCEALKHPETLPSDPAELVRTLAPTLESEGQRVVNALVEQVGRHRFSFDLMGKGEAQLEFTDKLDCFLVHPRSRKLHNEAIKDGIDPVANRLAAQFARLDHARGQTLRLIQNVMSEAGMTLDDQQESWWFGRTHRQAEFKVGRSLTLLLDKQTPVQLVHAWLRQLPSEFLAPIPSPGDLTFQATQEPKPIQKRWLPQQALAQQDPLPHLSSVDVPAMDHKAQECISRALQAAAANPGISQIGETQDLLSLWSEGLWYRDGDAWVTKQWWLDFARAAWRQNRRDLAAVLLLWHGEQPEEFNPQERFDRYDVWDNEAFEDALVWYFVEELPWAIDDGEYPTFPKGLSPRPPQLARPAARSIQAALVEHRRAPDAAKRSHLLEEVLRHARHLDRQSAHEWLSAAELADWASLVQAWARESDFQSGPEADDLFAVAAGMQWSWLPEVLANNPAYIPAQFYAQELYSEPGKVALRVSWVRPCELAARFAAQSLQGTPPNLKESKARKIAGSPEYFAAGLSIIQNWEVVDQFAAAIAWQRCRSAGVL
jgi:hypothetical protein